MYHTLLCHFCDDRGHPLIPLALLPPPSVLTTAFTSTMDYHSNPPPPYPGTGAKVPPAYDDASQPLLGNSSRSGIYHQPGPGEIPDDFLVSQAGSAVSSCAHCCAYQYGATVAECALQVRNEFVRKVYTILCEYPKPASLTVT